MKILMLIVQVLTAAIVIYGFANWKRVKEAKLELLIFLQLISFLTEVISVITVSIYRNNLIGYNTFVLFETTIMLLLLGSWNSPSLFSNILRLLSTAFLIFWSTENLFINTIWLKVGTWSLLIGGLIIVFSSTIYLFKFSNESKTNITHSPKFWVAVSYLVMCSGSSILRSIKILLDTSEAAPYTQINLIHMYFHTFATLILFKALSCLPKQQTLSS